MTSPRIRDALAVARINRIKARSVAMQKAAAARAQCDCPACRGVGRPIEALFALLGGEPEPETPPDNLKAH